MANIRSPQKGRQIPDEDHIARYVRPRLILTDPTTGAVTVSPDAFKPRTDETDLSANWLEHFSGSQEKQVSSVRKEMRAGGFNVVPKSAFVVGNVGEIKTACTNRHPKRTVRIVSSPTEKIPSHVSVKTIPEEDINLLCNCSGVGKV